MTNRRRIATANGAMLADADLVGNLLEEAGQRLFEPQFWHDRSEFTPIAGGRGAAYFVGPTKRQWVLRHFRRGGFIANFSRDRYFWRGEALVRSFAEWDLLEWMATSGLPVPRPVAAGYHRAGLTYVCALLTERIPRAEPMSALLTSDSLRERDWRAVGTTVRRFHNAGVDHIDLNAHNILLRVGGEVSVIDFDRGRRRTAGAWQKENLERLRRSLDKISRPMPGDRFGETQWQWLEAGYSTGA